MAFEKRHTTGSSFEGFPCIFPVDQGSDSRDEFAPDCLHRHSVCGCGDRSRELRHRPKNPAIPRGIGRRAPVVPNQRPRLQRLDEAPVRIRLCWHFVRFGFALHSIARYLPRWPAPRSVPKVGRPEIATLKLRSASGGVSKTSPADADRFSAEYATETQPSPDAQVVGVPRVGGLHCRYVWREAA
jgi:hypothetical protein